MNYTDSHEWIIVEGNIGVVGISAYAQKELGEVVYVDLPEVGQEVAAQGQIAVLESTKAAVDIYSPVSGKIVEVNEKLKTDPNLLNTSPEREGWLFKIALKDFTELEGLCDHKQYSERYSGVL